jgi:hypothetical protein
MHHIYITKPYHVGPKEGKTLAVCIHSNIADDCKFDTSTIFVVRVEKDKKLLTLKAINDIVEEVVPVGTNHNISSQQTAYQSK